jgi:hypothetical protein
MTIPGCNNSLHRELNKNKPTKKDNTEGNHKPTQCGAIEQIKGIYEE